MTVSNPNYPHTFSLRWAREAPAANVGFFAPVDENLPGFQDEVFGEIPKLSGGDGANNDGANVTFQAFDRFDRGGMGAREAGDPSRYSFAFGAYCGDHGETILQALAAHYADTTASVTSAMTIRQILPWVVSPRANPVGPVTGQAAAAGVGVLAAATYYYKITALVGGKESTPSAAATLTLSSSGGGLVNWNLVSNATAYRVYRATVNSDANFQRIAELPGTQLRNNGAGTSFRYHDDGKATPNGALPATSAAPGPAGVQRVLLVVCSDSANTTLYQVPYNGTAGALGTSLAYFAPWNQTNQGSVYPGVVEYNGCTIYQNRVILMTTNANESQPPGMIYYDADQPGSTPWQIRGLDGPKGRIALGDGDRRLWVFNWHQASWCGEPFVPQPEWQGPINVGGADLPVLAALLYGGSQATVDSPAIDGALYLCKADGLYRIVEGADGPERRAERVASFGLADPQNGVTMWEHNGELWVAARAQLFRYTIGSASESDPNDDGAIPLTLQGYVMDGQSTGRHSYLLTVAPGGHQQILETRNGEAFHQYFVSKSAAFNEVAPAGDRWTGRCLALVSPHHTNDAGARLLFAGGVHGNQLWSQPLRRGSEKLRQATGYTPIAQGELTLPVFFGESRYSEKVWHWVSVVQDAATAPVGATLRVDGRFERPAAAPQPYEALTLNANRADGDPLRTTLETGSDGRFYTTNSFRQEMSGKTRRKERKSDGIGLRLVFGPGGGVTPVLRGVVLGLTPSIQALQRWTFDIEIALRQRAQNGAQFLDTAEQVFAKKAQLVAFARNSGPVVFTDQTGAERIVWVTLSPFRYPRWKDHKNTNNVAEVLPYTISCQVILTELYNDLDYTHDF